eukprot:8157921-Alexandrium_andersonii.AAC.1
MPVGSADAVLSKQTVANMRAELKSGVRAKSKAPLSPSERHVRVDKLRAYASSLVPRCQAGLLHELEALEAQLVEN